MKRLLLETSFSKIYMIVMIIITFIMLGVYFSYAMFTVSKEKSNAITIITGNLVSKLEVDGTEGNKLTVPGSTTKEFTVTLSNPNNRIARFNFYYEGSLPSGVTAGYVTGEGLNTPPAAVGVNLEKSGSAGSSNIYKIRVKNDSSSSVTITLGVQVGLDYNDLALPSNGHLFEEIKLETVADYVLADQGDNGDTFDDGTDTFITGTDPNNYIWYSGKLWRAVSVNKEEKTTKLVTQWNISAIYYSSGSTAFAGSYMEDWLNDTTVDGFLGNLRDYENFIVTDSVWDATMDATDLGSIARPSDGGTIVTDAVGLLNMYEYQSSYRGTTYSNGYLNNGLIWWTLTPYSSSSMHYVDYDGTVDYSSLMGIYGVRPSINLKSSIRIVDGDGTIDNPYRLNGDDDINLSGTLLSSRYSGEYIKFGNGENNLYRIVSHENGSGTKIVSNEPLKISGTFITSAFDITNSSTKYSTSNTIGTFLNTDYLNTDNAYLNSEDIEKIEDETIWYLGTVGSGVSHKLAKYTDTNMSSTTSSTTDAKVGLLRVGELMAGQFDKRSNNNNYWLLTPFNERYGTHVTVEGNFSDPDLRNSFGIRPSLNLKSNVVITGGTGTKSDPFTLKLG